MLSEAHRENRMEGGAQRASSILKKKTAIMDAVAAIVDPWSTSLQGQSPTFSMHSVIKLAHVNRWRTINMAILGHPCRIAEPSLSSGFTSWERHHLLGSVGRVHPQSHLGEVENCKGVITQFLLSCSFFFLSSLASSCSFSSLVKKRTPASWIKKPPKECTNVKEVKLQCRLH